VKYGVDRSRWTTPKDDHQELRIDVDPDAAYVVDGGHDGIVPLHVLPGQANAHLELLDPRPA
jgi:hypothetical protein